MKRALTWGSWLVVLGSLAWCVGGVFRAPESDPGAFDYAAFGRLPVSYQGRVKPMDTVARNTLLMLSQRQTVELSGEKRPAIEWLAEALFHPEAAELRKVFRVDHPDLRDLIGRSKSQDKLFSYALLKQFGDKIQVQARKAQEKDDGERTLYQRKLLELYSRMNQYFRLPSHDLIHLIPPLEEDQEWQTLVSLVHAGQEHPALGAYKEIYWAFHPEEAAEQEEASWNDVFKERARSSQLWLGRMTGWAVLPSGERARELEELYRAHPERQEAALAGYLRLKAYGQGSESARRFNEAVYGYRATLEEALPGDVAKADFEARFNAAEPFYKSLVCYVVMFVMVILSYLCGAQTRRSIQRAAFWLLVGVLVVHTAGLAARVYISGRPPVTNLYSSAVFIGWGGALFALALEWYYRNGVGTLMAGVLGFASLLIAQWLAMDGDTMAMLQAVLDTNFWLATHVVVITLGYSSTFLAGFLGIVYVFGGLCSQAITKERGKHLQQMVYGTVCFSVLFSFVGTILGGLWADQSWGRFWGWDPKENGALLIVLWNALVLHARWGGVVQQRGLMVLAIGGNVITAWSWFGTNLLGVGLHSYGFMEGALWNMLIFAGTQVWVMWLGMAPAGLWSSALVGSEGEGGEPSGGLVAAKVGLFMSGLVPWVLLYTVLGMFPRFKRGEGARQLAGWIGWMFGFGALASAVMVLRYTGGLERPEDLSYGRVAALLIKTMLKVAWLGAVPALTLVVLKKVVGDFFAERREAAEAGTSEVGTSEVGTSEVGTSEVGTSEAGTSEAGTSEVEASEPSAETSEEESGSSGGEEKEAQAGGGEEPKQG